MGFDVKSLGLETPIAGMIVFGATASDAAAPAPFAAADVVAKMLAGGVTMGAGETLELNQTWNDGGTLFKGIVLDVTDTASDVNSVLLKFDVNSTEQFSFTKAGKFTANTGTYVRSSGGNFTCLIQWTGLSLQGNRPLSWGNSTSGVGGAPQNLVLGHEFAGSGEGTLAVYSRTASTAGRVNVYNDSHEFASYDGSTPGTNFERGYARWASDVFEVGTEAGGTGTERQWRIGNSVTYIDQQAVVGLPAANSIVLTAPHYVAMETQQVSVMDAGVRKVSLSRTGGVSIISTAQFRLASGSNAGAGDSGDTGFGRQGAAYAKITDGDTGVGQLLFIVPTVDPAVSGALWNNGGTLAISAG